MTSLASSANSKGAHSASGTNDAISSIIRSQFEFFFRDCTKAPEIAEGSHRSIGIDNRQKSQYNLSNVRERLKIANIPLVQIVGDSGSPFDEDKVSKAQTLLLSQVAGCAIEYGFTAAKYDTNWLVSDYHSSHPETILIASVVEQALEMLESGMEGYEGASTFVVLFDRLSPTRFGDDVWLSDGVMDRKYGDKMLCLEGGPQALYQCCNALLVGIPVVVVVGLRDDRFSAARFFRALKGGPESAEKYLGRMRTTPKQLNVSNWCLSRLQESDLDIASLIIPIDVE